MNNPAISQLPKAWQIVGERLIFRDVDPTDAKFILSLRTDSHKSRFLSNTGPGLESQIAWLYDYKSRSDQVYFIIEDQGGEALGTVRLYDAHGDSFCWGSWILKEGSPQSAAIESALMVYAYAIDCLGFRQSHFDVRKGNRNVWRFHERFGAVRIGETEQDYLYQIGYEQIAAAREHYRKYLPENITVEVLGEH